MDADDVHSGLMNAVLARNHAQQDFLDRVEFGGVDERIGTDVQIGNEHRRVVASAGQCNRAAHMQKQHVDVVGQPRNGVESAYEDHSLDHVGLTMVIMVLTMLS